MVGPVLFFDGTCGLCNRIVRGLLWLDRRAVLRFAPLQGPTAQAYLRAHGLPTEDFDSLVFVPEWEGREQRKGEGVGYLRRTEGALAALAATSRVGRGIAALARIFPPTWRDAAYRLVARWRYRVFGEWRPRPLARADRAARFLA